MYLIIYLVYHSVYITKEGIYHTLFLELCCKHKTVAHNIYNHLTGRYTIKPSKLPFLVLHT